MLRPSIHHYGIILGLVSSTILAPTAASQAASKKADSVYRLVRVEVERDYRPHAQNPYREGTEIFHADGPFQFKVGWETKHYRVNALSSVVVPAVITNRKSVAMTARTQATWHMHYKKLPLDFACKVEQSLRSHGLERTEQERSRKEGNVGAAGSYPFDIHLRTVKSLKTWSKNGRDYGACYLRMWTGTAGDSTKLYVRFIYERQS